MIKSEISKAGAEVKAGDVIEISFGTKPVKVRVLNVQETVRKEDAQNMYEVL